LLCRSFAHCHLPSFPTRRSSDLGNLTGSISATFNGTSATANLFNGQNGHANVKITSATDNSVIYDGTASTVVNNLNRLVAGQSYNVVVNSVGFNFGANNAGKEVTL